MSKWNRRQFLSGLLAAVGAGSTSTSYAEALIAGEPPAAPSDAPSHGAEDLSPHAARVEPAAGGARPALTQDGEEHALHELLPRGLRFGRWRVVAVHPVKHGAVPVVVETQSGRRFQIDFLANNGRGNTPTVEEQGVGLLWLAALLRPREGRVRPGMLLTQRERVRMFPRGRFDVVQSQVDDHERRAAEARATATPSTRTADLSQTS